MRRNKPFIILFLAITALCLSSCIKNLEDEGIYVTTNCHGILLDQRSQQPLQNITIVTTNGDIILRTVYSDSTGSFTIPISASQINSGSPFSYKAPPSPLSALTLSPISHPSPQYVLEQSSTTATPPSPNTDSSTTPSPIPPSITIKFTPTVTPQPSAALSNYNLAQHIIFAPMPEMESA